MRTIIIGDIHGCNQELCALLEKAQPGPEDRVILLGDLFDRGGESWEVFQTVKELAEELGERFTLLRGNHEDYLMQKTLSRAQRKIWDQVGRGATVDSFTAHGAKMEDAIPWLQEHCRMFYRDEAIQCVHAGLKVDPIEVNDTWTLIHDHEIALQNLYTGRLTVVGHIGIEEPTWFAGDGETTETLPYDERMPLPEQGMICIDTGCGKGGKLTAMMIDEHSEFCLIR